MIDQSKQKIVGAFVIGFAIVAGAYLANNFGQSSLTSPETQTATAVNEAPERVLIAVADQDSNGIEDWRDKFVSSDKIVFNATDTDYKAPTTLTGQMSISFMQSIISAKGAGPLGKSQEEVIKDTAAQIATFGSDKIIDIKDVIVTNDSSPESVRSYANAAADAVLANNAPGLRNELLILRDTLTSASPKDNKDLETISKVYLNTLNDTKSIPVPQILLKEHLDLLNVYNALHFDIAAMAKSQSDPMLTLVRVKRYEDDAKGLVLALNNLYAAIEPFASAFDKDDSAILFVSFSPKIQ